jgi:hypothetical protein
LYLSPFFLLKLYLLASTSMSYRAVEKSICERPSPQYLLFFQFQIQDIALYDGPCTYHPSPLSYPPQYVEAYRSEWASMCYAHLRPTWLPPCSMPKAQIHAGTLSKVFTGWVLAYRLLSNAKDISNQRVRFQSLPIDRFPAMGWKRISPLPQKFGYWATGNRQSAQDLDTGIIPFITSLV